MTCLPQTGPCWSRGISVLFRHEPPNLGDISWPESATHPSRSSASSGKPKSLSARARPLLRPESRSGSPSRDARWALEPGGILHAGWGEGSGRALAARIHPNQAAQLTGISASGTWNERTMASGLRSVSPSDHGSRTLIGSGTTFGGRSLFQKIFHKIWNSKLNKYKWIKYDSQHSWHVLLHNETRFPSVPKIDGNIMSACGTIIQIESKVN